MDYLNIFMTVPKLGDSITITGDVNDLDFRTRTTDVDNNFLYLLIMLSLLDIMTKAKYGHLYMNLDTESKDLFVSYSKAHDYILALKLLHDTGCLLDGIKGQTGDDELDGFNNELIGLDYDLLKSLYEKVYKKVLDFAINDFAFYLPGIYDHLIHTVESVIIRTSNGLIDFDYMCSDVVCFIQLMIDELHK